MTLCWMCKEKLLKYEGPSSLRPELDKYLQEHPTAHCHHEESEEKIRCPVCFTINTVVLAEIQEENKLPIRVPMQYCPACGKKLWRKL